jgi:hypothetical protein
MRATPPEQLLSRILILGIVFSLLLASGCTSVQQQPSQTVQSLQSSNTSYRANSSNIRSALPDGTQKTSAKSSSQSDLTELATVKLLRVNIREQPNKSSAVVEEVGQGGRLHLVSSNPTGAWYRVRHQATGSEGWVHGNGIVITNAKPGTQARESQPQEREDSGYVTNIAPNENTRRSSSGRYYRNVDGDLVRSPTFSSTAPEGATARCSDGSYSFSRNRRGTCSHHGGVAEWLN